MMLKHRASNYHKLPIEFRRRISHPTGLFSFLVLLLVLLCTFFFFFRPRSIVLWSERPTVAQWSEQFTVIRDGSAKAKDMGMHDGSFEPKAKDMGLHDGSAKAKAKAKHMGMHDGSAKAKDMAISIAAPKHVTEVKPPKHTEVKSPTSPPRHGQVKSTTPLSKDTQVKLPTSPPTGNGRVFNCSVGNACSSWQPDKFVKEKWDPKVRRACPSYFGFIEEDLKPWRESGITLEMVERARRTASFRLVILKGRMYIRTYSKSFQTRDVFTIWGLIQLMENYGGMLPDLDLMFDCVDWPVIRAYAYANATLPPPPLFRYCGDDKTLDIAFPDWSFWGWAEVNTRPWDGLLNDIRKGTKKLKWEDRDPTAFWKGNPYVAAVREDLMKCNLSDWNARLYNQDWIRESGQGFKHSKLPDQCHHRYKIYVEGSAWSVSLKNILACDSPTLMVKPLYYDFFSRALMPLEHYWPIRLDRKCESIKFAVDWGNNHTDKAKAIGEAGSNFMSKELKMSNVYDYMFHLLTEYAKLLKYKPVIPKGAKEVCSQSMLCSRKDRVERRFMRESMVKSPTGTGPCNLHIQHGFLEDWNHRKTEAIKHVEDMEETAWRDLKTME